MSEQLDFDRVEEYKLSKKQKNILSKAVAGLKVVNYEGASKLRVGDQLEGFTYFDTFRTSGGTNLLRPQIVERLFGVTKRDKKASYINGLARHEDLGCIIGFSTKIATRKAINQQDSETGKPTLRLVLGATEEVPLRFASYALPAMLAQKRLFQLATSSEDSSSCVPQLEIMFARNISTTLNSLNPTLTLRSQEYMREMVERVAEELGLEEVISFSEDKIDDLDRVKDYANILGDILNDQELEALTLKGGSNDPTASLMYAAAHCYIHDDSSIAQDSLVDFGGLQETFFIEIRDKVGRELYGDVYSPVPMIITRHSTPPYYMARGGDISYEQSNFGDLGEIDTYDFPDVSATAHYDLAFLEEHSSLGAGFTKDIIAQNTGNAGSSLHV